ncbi:MAG TPA: hypothetical protein VIM73_06875, partial [Polyangiaceae bacterium]
MLRTILLCLLCLLVTFGPRVSKGAVEPEDVELEEEPVAQPQKPDSSRATKSAKKKPRREKVVEVIEVPDEPEPAPKKKEKPKPAPKKAAPAAAAPAAEKKPAPEPEAEAEAFDAGPNIPGLECSPAVTEIETRRPVPISCAVTKKGAERVEIRYRTPDTKEVVPLTLKKDGAEWTGEIPCTATGKTGELEIGFTALGAKDRVIARIKPVTMRLTEATSQSPPSLPGKEPPLRCYAPGECPPEFKGTPTCPGTKAPTAGYKAWGAACTASRECVAGLACVSGTCDQPPKCEVTPDCPKGGECVDGVCFFPDPEEMANRLADPRFNWIGLHFGADLLFARDAAGVCGNESDDSADYACFNGGDLYDGTVNQNYGGTVDAGPRLATMRVLVSFDRWFGRIAAGARLGFAFGGAPEDFLPLHLELRGLYSLRRDPMIRRFRPYLGLAAGLAQVDSRSTANVIDCTDAGPNCREATLAELQAGVSGARELSLDAYRSGGKFFFGPALGFVYAFSSEHAMQLNLNVMFPDVVFQPSL